MKPQRAEFGLDLQLGWELSATGALVGDLSDYVLEGTRAILLELPGPWFSFDDEVAVTRDQAAAIRAAGFEVVLWRTPSARSGCTDSLNSSWS